MTLEWVSRDDHFETPLVHEWMRARRDERVVRRKAA